MTDGNDKNEQQRNKLEALGRFAGGIAHDFNNILSIIEGHARAAIKSCPDAQPSIDKILQATARGAGLTRQLLAFSRQRVGIDLPCDVCAVLRQSAGLIQPLLGAAIRVELDLPAAPLVTAAGEDPLSQVILNLALNARDAMPHGGRIVIRARKAEEMAEITFTDNGNGIAPEALPHIFDPFYTTRGTDGGTGLGLAVVHGIVTQQRGTIAAESKAGYGTSFRLRLPLAEAAAAVAPLSGASLKGRTVLLAEDEPELRDILSVMLQGMDMRVLPAANGNDALRVQESFKGDIDFLLTDIVMPEMDGVRLGKVFTVKRPGTNVIYMSGYPFIDGTHPLQVPETAAFIAKPLQEETVRQVLERALARRDRRLADGEDPE